MTVRRAIGRKGFTLIEIMIALVVLSIVVIGMSSATGNFLHQVTIDDITVSAIALADDRVETILMDPNYQGLDTAYVATESSFPGLPGITRATVITRVGGSGQSQDHKRIVVTVSGPGLQAPIKRSATVAAP